jgi:predicted membrane GTPase involved in stress response
MNIPDARQVSDNISAGDTSAALTRSMVDSLSTAVGNKASSMTFSVSGKTAADVMAVISEMRRKGYKITGSGTTLTISW